MAIDPVKIPADIQIEDKIIGPVGLRQIFILMGCGAFSYAIWTFMKNLGYVSLPSTLLAWSPVGVGAAFAFVKVNDVSLFTLLLLGIERLQKPARRVFGPRYGITITISTGSKPTEKKKEEQTATVQKQTSMSELSSALDTQLPVSAPELNEVQADKVEEPENLTTKVRGHVSASPTDGAPIDDIQTQESTPETEEESPTSQEEEPTVFRDILPPRS